MKTAKILAWFVYAVAFVSAMLFFPALSVLVLLFLVGLVLIAHIDGDRPNGGNGDE